MEYATMKQILIYQGWVTVVGVLSKKIKEQAQLSQRYSAIYAGVGTSLPRLPG